MGMKIWLGIDFSGDYLMWRKGCARSNVWLSVVEELDGRRNLKALMPVQELPEALGEEPFYRLVGFLRTANFLSAAIDAPFSLPGQFVPEDDYLKLLAKIDRIPVENSFFPKGIALVKAVAGRIPRRKTPALYRETEKFWLRQGLNVRPTLWTKGRPGAPLTSACLKLLAQSGCPIWPWEDKTQKRLLVEAFPTAQLKIWGLPYFGYGDNIAGAGNKRLEIISAVQNRLTIPSHLRNKMLASADALDAVICAFAAMAVTEDKLAFEPDREFSGLEGWIAVHS